MRLTRWPGSDILSMDYTNPFKAQIYSNVTDAIHI